MEKLDIRGIELNLLIIFQAMMKELSVTGVAEALELSQPNVSYALKKLRECFGDQLFIRSAQGMQPTAKALALSEPIQRMIDILRNEILPPSTFVPESSRRHFVINTTDIGEISFIPPIIKHLRVCSPLLSLECICLRAQDLVDALRTGKVDLAVGYYPEITVSTVYSQALMKHPFVCLARQGHPLTEHGLTLENYIAADHIGVVGEGHSQRIIDERIRKSGIERRIAFQTQNFMTVPFIVKETDMIATVPKFLAIQFAEHLGLKVLQPPFEIEPISLKQYWTDRQRNDPGQIWLRQTIAEFFQNKDPTVDVHFW